ncbi:DUF1348 family protein [Hymenobacter sp. UYCo722]|uniref:DUF1348 family protein n=1 Tax=Hymenobacter sp. UYCo722 TaxID=3156335 RepID=UPI00339800FF
MPASSSVAAAIAEQPAFSPYRGERHLPGPDVTTPEALENFIRDYTMTIYHPVGTCKMSHDALAVVDDALRVRGIAGLRVADASIMAIIINSNVPTIVIGGKCADMQLQEVDYKLKKELWGFRENHMAVRFEYEYHDAAGQWWRAYGNELWEFAPNGLMQRRFASINDLAIREDERQLR